MQRLTLKVPVGSFSPGDAFDVFGNVDGAGRATASIDYSRSLTGAPQPFWPFFGAGPGFASEGFLQGPFLGVPGDVPDDHEVVTPPLYFGWYRFGVITYDNLGNASDGEPAAFAAFVNSGPRPPRNFKQADVAEDGRPVFSFAPPAQFEAAS